MPRSVNWERDAELLWLHTIIRDPESDCYLYIRQIGAAGRQNFSAACQMLPTTTSTTVPPNELVNRLLLMDDFTNVIKFGSFLVWEDTERCFFHVVNRARHSFRRGITRNDAEINAYPVTRLQQNLANILHTHPAITISERAIGKIRAPGDWLRNDIDTPLTGVRVESNTVDEPAPNPEDTLRYYAPNLSITSAAEILYHDPTRSRSSRLRASTRINSHAAVINMLLRRVPAVASRREAHVTLTQSTAYQALLLRELRTCVNPLTVTRETAAAVCSPDIMYVALQENAEQNTPNGLFFDSYGIIYGAMLPNGDKVLWNHETQ